MPLPGPNRTHCSARRFRLLPAQLLFQARPQPMRTLDQAVAQGRRIDEAASRQGYDDAAAGFVFDPRDLDDISYAAGFVAGTKFRRSKGES